MSLETVVAAYADDSILVLSPKAMVTTGETFQDTAEYADASRPLTQRERLDYYADRSTGNERMNRRHASLGP
jgi:hypothetical protein